VPPAEPSTLEIDVYVRRYALLVVLARNEWMNDPQYLNGSFFWPTPNNIVAFVQPWVIVV